MAGEVMAGDDARLEALAANFSGMTEELQQMKNTVQEMKSAQSRQAHKEVQEKAEAKAKAEERAAKKAAAKNVTKPKAQPTPGELGLSDKAQKKLQIKRLLDGWMYMTHHVDGTLGTPRLRPHKVVPTKQKTLWIESRDGEHLEPAASPDLKQIVEKVQQKELKRPVGYNLPEVSEQLQQIRRKLEPRYTVPYESKGRVEEAIEEHSRVWICCREQDVWICRTAGLLAVSPFENEEEVPDYEPLIEELIKIGVKQARIVVPNDVRGRKDAVSLVRGCEQQGLAFEVYALIGKTANSLTGRPGHGVCEEFKTQRFDADKLGPHLKALPRVGPSTIKAWDKDPEANPTW